MPEVDDANDLYDLPPEEFTAARDALARKIRASKDPERAAEVKKLRRPSTLAWGLNQVARADADLIESVLAAGNQVKEALDRGDGPRIREGERSMRTATNAVVDAASRVMSDSGHTATDEARSRVAATLRAALVDSEVADRVRAGTLDRDVELAGLGLDDVAVPVSRVSSSSRRSRKRTPDRSQETQEDSDKRRLQDGERRAARARVAELETNAERITGRARRQAGLAERAEEAAREARAEADELNAEAIEAAERASAAKAELEAGDSP